MSLDAQVEWFEQQRVHLAEVLRIVKESGASRVDFGHDGNAVRIEFPAPPHVFEVVTPKTNEEQAEPGGYETALERMARGGKKEAPKT